ncbi:Ferredoxin reductase [[Actinomadura] parvosata subsp. kistnae]|uniref:Lantibiotic ABC transporter n=1 Tax=[Actinomadura] parvosata subsp. kistnae TaxID=1909395 RepID=A0A1U9ZXJ3_9ACTN|nr:BtrH N-terminal domain-containing protein [Nonomuraea sp. ATCC 55076]AQZ62664.1 lantibiotic ABC transporter [Nonomuraea sp. ATCC 55076]SPL88961.1 Ferredoxin reductase [Actinomadura parvosata subsp. kistnae]
MTMVKDVEARGTQHCETTALGVLLRHEGLDLSEPMLFGLGSGLSFVYWDGKNLPFPFLGGRVKPFELTRNLAARLGATLTVAETASARKAWENVAAPLDAGRPVGLQLDCYHLDYFTTRIHFGGHVVAMYGYDDRDAYLVDTGPQGGAVRTSRDSLARARAERGPMTARNRSFTLTLPAGPPSWQAAVLPAVRHCAEAFLAAPIANLGHRGIAKAGDLVPGWLRRAADPRRDLPQAALLMERAGTGGALFRALFRDFLQECTGLVDADGLRTGHRLYAEAATLWTEVSALIGKAGESGDPALLERAGAVLHDLARIEGEAMQVLRQV